VPLYDQIKGFIGVREVFRVGHVESDLEPLLGCLCPSPFDHCLGEVGPRRSMAETGQLQRQKASAATDVQNVNGLRARPAL
jgi:hypothetical protein